MKILVLPWDPNPYQQELYGVMASVGHHVRFAGRLTRSQSLNFVLLPFEILFRGFTGHRIVHLHWVNVFTSPVLTKSRFGRRVQRAWFGLTARLMSLCGISLLWVAHNVMPHEQVFDDDVAGRRALLRNSKAVMVHSSAVLEQLVSIAPLPRIQAVVRHPAYEVPAAAFTNDNNGVLRVLFFGNVMEYKGVPDLLAAARRAGGRVHVTVAGNCSDASLRRQIKQYSNSDVCLRLERISDEHLNEAINLAHVVVLPFRQVTTSGTALYAMSAGRAVVLPDLAAFADIPSNAVIRYSAHEDPVEAIARVLMYLCSAPESLKATGDAARAWARAYRWSDLAQALTDVSERCLAVRR